MPTGKRANAAPMRRGARARQTTASGKSAKAPKASDSPVQSPSLSRANGRVVLEVRDLRIDREKTQILRGLNWRALRGEHWVILGPNGSGKSSLLAALTGYLTPTAGEVELLGRRYGRSHWGELRKLIGIVGAGMPRMIEPSTTAYETVLGGHCAMLNPYGHFPAVAHRRAKRLLAWIGLAHIADRWWIELSEGERQRTLVARALMAKPKVLFLDEPCAGMDPVARAAFLKFLEQLAAMRRGPALVLVTHHVEEIVRGFSHALLLRGGKVGASGKIRDTLTSSKLAKTFGAPLRLTRERAGYRLALR